MIRTIIAVSLGVALSACSASPSTPAAAQEARPDPLPGTKLSVDQLKAQGKVSRGWLGVQIQDVTRELAESFGMKKPQGALVSKILPKSPAEAAGIQVGDIIEVNFPRPRERKAVMEHPDYYKLRERLIEFLEVHAHRRKPKPVEPVTPPPSAATPKNSLQLVA